MHLNETDMQDFSSFTEKAWSHDTCHTKTWSTLLKYAIRSKQPRRQTKYFTKDSLYKLDHASDEKKVNLESISRHWLVNKDSVDKILSICF